MCAANPDHTRPDSYHASSVCAIPDATSTARQFCTFPLIPPQSPYLRFGLASGAQRKQTATEALTTTTSGSVLATTPTTAQQEKSQHLNPNNGHAFGAKPSQQRRMAVTSTLSGIASTVTFKTAVQAWKIP